MLSPTPNEIGTRQIWVLWDLIVGGASRAATAFISGGRPDVGAAVGALGIASRSVPPIIQELVQPCSVAVPSTSPGVLGASLDALNTMRR
jgi:hypothetical protein